MAYQIHLSEPAKRQLRGLTARERSMALDAIKIRLLHQPLVQTRNRKPVRDSPTAQWELRVEPLRIYYEVTTDDDPTVSITAIGRKRGSDVIFDREDPTT